MRSSFVSGPYASAVSMKLTPSSTARRKTFFAFSRSGGQPQIPSPVNRIAPKPSRLTKRSPPNKNVSSLACPAVAQRRRVLMLPLASGIAATSSENPPVKTPAALARLTSKNVLRFIAGKICCRYRLSTLLLFRVSDDSVGGSIFHRASRIHELRFSQNLTTCQFRHASQPNQRRVPYVFRVSDDMDA